MSHKVRRWRIADLVFYVVALAALGIGIAALVIANQQPGYHGGGECQGYDSRCCRERAAAINVFNGFDDGINLLTANPTLSTQIIANYFSPYGIWSLPFQAAPIVGPVDIYNFFIGYALNPGETNQTVVTKQVNWDCLTKTLTVQRVWYAVLTQPRAFTPGSMTTLPAGTEYSQDDLIVMRFNCNFTKGNGYNSIVYYREYYDNTQSVSTYTDLIAPVCPARYSCPVVI